MRQVRPKSIARSLPESSTKSWQSRSAQIEQTQNQVFLSFLAQIEIVNPSEFSQLYMYASASTRAGETELGAHRYYLMMEVCNCRVFDCRPVFDEKDVADGSAAYRSWGAPSRYPKAYMLFGCINDGLQVLFLEFVWNRRLAVRDCLARDEVHDDVSTTPDREASEDSRDAERARRVRVQDTGNVILHETLADVKNPVLYRSSLDMDTQAVPMLAARRLTQCGDNVDGRDVFRGTKFNFLHVWLSSNGSSDILR